VKWSNQQTLVTKLASAGCLCGPPPHKLVTNVSIVATTAVLEQMFQTISELNGTNVACGDKQKLHTSGAACGFMSRV